MSPPWGHLLSVMLPFLFVFSHSQSGYGIPPSSKPSRDPQQDISEIRCTLLKMLLVLVADEIAKVCHDTVAVLVALFESFQGMNHWNVWMPQTHKLIHLYSLFLEGKRTKKRGKVA